MATGSTSVCGTHSGRLPFGDGGRQPTGFAELGLLKASRISHGCDHIAAGGCWQGTQAGCVDRRTCATAGSAPSSIKSLRNRSSEPTYRHERISGALADPGGRSAGSDQCRNRAQTWCSERGSGGDSKACPAKVAPRESALYIGMGRDSEDSGLAGCGKPAALIA